MDSDSDNDLEELMARLERLRGVTLNGVEGELEADYINGGELAS